MHGFVGDVCGTLTRTSIRHKTTDQEIAMRLRGIKGSRNIEDRRRAGGSGGRGRAAGGIGGVGLIVVLALGYFTGVDVSSLLDGGNTSSEQPRQISAEDDRAAQFTSSVLATTEQVWTKIFREQLNREYNPPVLVLFSGVTQSPCGGASGATGPFYCPADKKAYLDTSFFTTMSERLGAGGDFAAAYVIAHEVAHHVQNELGILPQVDQARRASSQNEANALTVRLELMADCLSGVWARNVQGLMERGDLEEALNAARMIGDDHLQRQAGRVPNPHTFTHGTSAQRARWFYRGYDTGNVGQCDTFAAQRL
ncbi:MAG: putative metalloprotease [Ascidiaceihabitans sp.]|jgi:predicted metalloprotease